MAAANYEAAILLIDEAHAQDPNIAIVDGDEMPWELHYAQKSSHYLSLRCPDASPVLKTAVRAQHFRRWEVPRNSYPATKPGYISWRTYLKKRQANLAKAICIGCNYTETEAEAVGKLIRKEDLKNNEDTKVLEDVACLVFLEQQLEGFEKEIDDEDKVVEILRKSWAKMSLRGRELALEIKMGDRAKELVGKALKGERG